MISRITFLITIQLTISLVFGQNERAAHWFFGYEAGLDFSSGTVAVETNGKLTSIEGSCSISDVSGNLLFYSNGQTVWNQNHDTMPNSPGLLGDESAAQSSIIIPSPWNDGTFYLFSTAGGVSNTGLRYSVVDMNLNGGLGDVTSTKNVLLHSGATEELAATLHCDGTTYWVMTRQRAQDTLQFFAYPVDSNGVGAPVVSTFMAQNPLLNVVGGMTFSQDGKKLCFSSFETAVYIFDFDRFTGELTMKDTIVVNPDEQVYANAISPNGKMLYLSVWSPAYCRVSQFDLAAADVSGSRVDLDSIDFSTGSPNGYGFIGQLRLAPDQKIYCSRWNQDQPYLVHPDTYYSLDSIDVIHYPDIPGSSCLFERNYLSLEQKPTQIGLPNFVSNFTSPNPPSKRCDTTLAIQTLTEVSFLVYPNPFSERTVIRFNNADNQPCHLELYNSQGELVREIRDSYTNEFLIERDEMKAGIYFFRLVVGNEDPVSGKICVE